MKISNGGKLNIQKRPFPQWLTYFIFVMPFAFAFLQGFLGLPGLVKYTIDITWILVTGLIFVRRKIIIDKKLIPFLVFVGVFIAYTFTIYIFNFQSVFYYLWGFRNNFRFYFAFIAFCMLFAEEDAEICFKLMDILFWINAVITFFQFFVLGYKWDYLGGIFGVEVGCNACSIIFFSIVLSKSVLLYMDKKESFFSCFSKCAVALVIAAMAELKFFFVLFVIILLMSTILTSFTWQKFILVFVCVLLILFAGSLLTQLFGEGSSISIERLLELTFAESYSSADDLSRFSAVPTISNSIMTNNSQRLFGLGLGNCDTSSFAICNTPFFQIYGDLHYSWFSSAFLFLETGYIGLTIYMAFFLMCFVFAWNMIARKQANELYCRMAVIASILCIVLTFYNSSLRMEVAYIMYFVLALPLISSKANIQYQRRLNIHK